MKAAQMSAKAAQETAMKLAMPARREVSRRASARDGELAAGGECAEGDSSAEERVDAEGEGQEYSEAAEGRHGMQHGRASFLASIFAELCGRRRFAAR